MFAKLTALVSQSSLPFDVTSPFLPTAPGQWTQAEGTYHNQANTSDRSGTVSIFRLGAASEGDALITHARNGVKRLKMLRHPNILRYIDTIEVEEKGQHVVYLVTERVTSLEQTMGGVVSGMGQRDREKYLMMGLEQVVSAVSFLANDCGLIHGNVCGQAVCVTPQAMTPRTWTPACFQTGVRSSEKRRATCMTSGASSAGTYQYQRLSTASWNQPSQSHSPMCPRSRNAACTVDDTPNTVAMMKSTRRGNTCDCACGTPSTIK